MIIINSMNAWLILTRDRVRSRKNRLISCLNLAMKLWLVLARNARNWGRWVSWNQCPLGDWIWPSFCSDYCPRSGSNYLAPPWDSTPDCSSWRWGLKWTWVWDKLHWKAWSDWIWGVGAVWPFWHCPQMVMRHWFWDPLNGQGNLRSPRRCWARHWILYQNHFWCPDPRFCWFGFW